MSTGANAIPTDEQPPTPPVNVSAVPGDWIVYLTWAGSEQTDIIGYNIYRSETSGTGFALKNYCPVGEPFYNDYADNDTPYYYTITAIDQALRESAPSAEVVATPVTDTMPPGAPTNLSAVLFHGAVQLAWDASVGPDVMQYTILRGETAGGPYEWYTSTIYPYYDDHGIEVDHTYYYVIVARDYSGNESEYSDEVSVAIPADNIPPSAPTGLVATGAAGKIDLNWNDNPEGDLVGYNVYRSTEAGLNYTQVNAQIIRYSAYTDDLSREVAYYETAYSQSFEGEVPGDWTLDDWWLESPGEGGLPTDHMMAHVDNQRSMRSTTRNASGECLLTSPALNFNLYSVVTVSFDSYFYSWHTMNRRWVDVRVGDGPWQALGEVGTTPDTIETVMIDISKYAAGRSNVQVRWGLAAETSGYWQIDEVRFEGGVPAAPREYFYVVTAVDLSGNESGYSDEAGAIPVDAVPPRAPAGLIAQPSNGAVRLAWSDNTESDLAGYNVYRDASGTGMYPDGFQLLSSIPLGSTTYEDTAVNNGITYRYVVTAVDLYNNQSSPSPMVTVTPDGTPPGAPTGVAADAGDGMVFLTWSPSSEPDIACYNVRFPDPGGKWVGAFSHQARV